MTEVSTTEAPPVVITTEGMQHYFQVRNNREHVDSTTVTIRTAWIAHNTRVDAEGAIYIREHTTWRKYTADTVPMPYRATVMEALARLPHLTT